MSLKTENSRRVAKSRSVCMGLNTQNIAELHISTCKGNCEMTSREEANRITSTCLRKKEWKCLTAHMV
jgi:hypothetical protein